MRYFNKVIFLIVNVYLPVVLIQHTICEWISIKLHKLYLTIIILSNKAAMESYCKGHKKLRYTGHKNQYTTKPKAAYSCSMRFNLFFQWGTILIHLLKKGYHFGR